MGHGTIKYHSKGQTGAGSTPIQTACLLIRIIFCFRLICLDHGNRERIPSGVDLASASDPGLR